MAAATAVLDVPKVVALGAVAGTTTEVVLPGKARRALVGARGGDVRVSFTGTDGAAIGDAVTIASGTREWFPTPGCGPGMGRNLSGASLFCAPASTDSPSVEVLAVR